MLRNHGPLLCYWTGCQNSATSASSVCSVNTLATTTGKGKVFDAEVIGVNGVCPDGQVRTLCCSKQIEYGACQWRRSTLSDILSQAFCWDPVGCNPGETLITKNNWPIEYPPLHETANLRSSYHIPS